LTATANAGVLFTTEPLVSHLPEVLRFQGIVIQVDFRDHPPPHFHAVYADHPALYDIETFEAIEGDLPPPAAKLVVEWATLISPRRFSSRCRI
jgi:hypothetical protein